MAERIPEKQADRFCKALKPSTKTVYFNAGGGLRLRVTPAGSKLWVYNYNVKIAEQPIKGDDGKPIKGSNYKSRGYTIGAFKESDAQAHAFSYAGALKELRRLKTMVEAGNDPAAEKQRAVLDRMTEAAARMTVTELYAEWFEAEPSKRKDKGAEVARMFQKDILPHIGGLDINQIQKLHITRICQKVEKRGQRIAGVIFSLLIQFFSWSIDKGFIKDDSIISFRKRIGSTGNQRDRVLDDDELRELFRKLPDAGLSELHQLALKIQLGTACRIGELISANKAHIDLEARVWTVPPESSKNGLEHNVHLSDYTLPLFTQLMHLTGGSSCLFPAMRGTGEHADEKGITKAVADRQRQPDKIVKGRTTKHAQALMLSGGQWRPHDLRRTAATLMQDLGVLPDIIERCLNHKESEKVKGTYQRHDYREQRKEALELLGQRLALLEKAPDNVVILKQA